MAEELVPDSFLKGQNWVYLWINSFMQILFMVTSRGVSKCIETIVQTTCFYLIWSFFKQRGLELVSLPHFRHVLWGKIFPTLYSINWPNCIIWLPLLFEMLGNMCTAIVCLPNQSYLSVFPNDQKSQDKIWNILGTKIFFKMK